MVDHDGVVRMRLIPAGTLGNASAASSRSLRKGRDVAIRDRWQLREQYQQHHRIIRNSVPMIDESAVTLQIGVRTERGTRVPARTENFPGRL